MQSSQFPPAFSSVFFKEGLHFTCSGCGACCSGEPGMVRITQEDAYLIAKDLTLSVPVFLERYCSIVGGDLCIKELENGDCIFLQDKQCQIYALRPLQCKTYPFWSSLVRNENMWNREKSSCPGIGHGSLHTAEQILHTMYYNP